MKFMPSKKQWITWTLPSKASFIGVIIALVLFAGQVLINLYLDDYKKESDKPKIIIRIKNKPYLRYEVKSDTVIVFSSEFSFQNNGHNTAINLKYARINQKLSVNDNILVEVTNDQEKNEKVSKTKFGPPSLLISGDRYSQIFNLNGNDLNIEQVKDLINKYNIEELSVIIDIKLEYEDEITNRRQNTHEILNVYKGKVLILK